METRRILVPLHPRLKTSPITKMPVLIFATGPGGVLDGEQFSPPPADMDYNQPDAIR